MLIVIEIALALALVGIVGSYFFRRRHVAEREEITERRVAAYIQTVRREASNAQLSAMGDDELKDLLLSSARNLKLQSERKFHLLVGGGVATFLAAIFVGSADGIRGFAIALLIGAIALYGLNEFLGRRMREPLVEKGIDIERLRVE